MKKPKLYLETTIWNFLYATDAPEKMEITKQFFKEIEKGRYEIYISDFVLDEINDAKPLKRKLLEKEIERCNPIKLTPTETFEKLLPKYLSAEIVPPKYSTDLYHILMAVVNELDAVVSWNLSHIVKLRTKLEINSINRSLGLKIIEIITPEVVI